MKMWLERTEPAIKEERGRRVLRTEAKASRAEFRIAGTAQGGCMRYIRSVLIAMLVAVPFLVTSTAHAQVAVGVGVGPDVVEAPDAYGPPACDWGYYSYYPYSCAPYGYYGPGWVNGGVLLGVRPLYGSGLGSGRGG